MKVLSWILCVCSVAALPTFIGCESTAAAKVPVEKLPEVKATLPPVPTIPPAPFPVQYGDQSYSVYGLRRALRRTIGTDVNLTGYIAKVFVPPECPPKEKCALPPAPHFWLADTKDETDPSKYLLVGGYAENQKALDDAIKDSKKGKAKQAPPEDTGLIPVPTDIFPGAKIKLKGRFTYMSGAGFQSSEGVLDYAGHETLEPGTPLEPSPSAKSSGGGKASGGKAKKHH
ncbi:MAG TPA: hypothetical protein VGI70_20250 [Polyangiales bacterium]